MSILVLCALASLPAVWAADQPPSPLDVTKESPAWRQNVRGIMHYREGHMDVASHYFRLAIQADGTSAEAHYNLALALDGLGDHLAAAREFERALALAPENPAIARSAILRRHMNRGQKELMRQH